MILYELKNTMVRMLTYSNNCVIIKEKVKEICYMYIMDGCGEWFDFELSDKNGNNHFYSIITDNRQSAIKIAQKWFMEQYGHIATHLELNMTGFPIIKNYLRRKIMIAIFNKDYTVKFIDEDNIQSGQFTFIKGKGYQCELNKQKLIIWDFDKVLNIEFNKKQIDKYLGSVV